MSRVPARFELSSPLPPQSRQGCGCGWLIILIVIVAIGYSAVRYFIDQINFNAGQQAYQQADCATTIRYFDTILNGWRPVDIGSYSTLAQQKKAECTVFQGAVDQQQAGDFSAALVTYADFVRAYKSSLLVEAARRRSVSLFEQANGATLASQPLCQKLDWLIEQELIPQGDVSLPSLYFACGQLYAAANDQQRSFAMYEALLLNYATHSLATEAESVLLANPLTCDAAASFQENESFANRPDFMASLYYGCGQAYATKGDYDRALEMYKAFLVEYPEHPRVAEAETALLTNPASCEQYKTFQGTVIAERADFMPSLYYQCGQAYEGGGDWARAITMYETFLADYPSHALASDVKAALARAMIAQAKATNAGELPAPQNIGPTASGLTELVIRNESPERLRLVFSGPEVRVEELEACGSCQTYSGSGPSACPELGPSGRFTLQPGQYEVVVKSISDTGVTPWIGNWSLASGDEYHSCFFIVMTLRP